MKKCSYCGQANADGQTHCSGCGNPSPETEALEASQKESQEKKKSKTLAVILAVIFGPLGLLYLGGEGLIIILFVFGIGVFVFPLLVKAKVGLLVSLLVRLVCAVYAANAVDNRNGTNGEQEEALGLLNEAARLENKDMVKAIAKYQEVVAKFPDSRASTEAQRNIETLQGAVEAS
jgi:hypothetical protein